MTDTTSELGTVEITEIMRLLPHRYPFLLIDRIVDIDGDDSAIGIKNVTMNEPHFTGHFPENPIMPGVLIIEGMAQTAGAICAKASGGGAKNVFFMTIDNARFRKPVVPGDRIEFHVKKIKQRGNIWKFHCDAMVDGAKAAEADVGAMLASREGDAE
ncbi:MAG: 3-hydroxyacyl-[acyl-carrier-protein] dehydratase FabZ [Rhizobiales bacterium]|nr:3-hydroxyacyl-[acyl-carrier-protein] dehydratase FabZ [Hyphomicrobiales bacterium]MBA70037.1 3-hydroxyacyl-[acyl-carrier-protein] dehydratase FabZ [Hyphomicrobiales bacterium]|tara:strand:- start:564 stop:1034 length:471 start_codon:yes stop_codon:yes gene_type:complete